MLVLFGMNTTKSDDSSSDGGKQCDHASSSAGEMFQYPRPDDCTL